VGRPTELVRIVRNGLVESVHTGDVAVCDADGRLRAHAGDANRLLFGRSCEKPLQGAVSFAAMERDDLTDDEIGVLCASHAGEPDQVATVRRLLRRGPAPVSALQNPRDRATTGRRSPIWDECSGNHAGFLVASVRRGWSLATYRRPGHPLQRRVARAVLDATDVERPLVGVDGCGIPVHGVPLRAMATMFARLGIPDRLGKLAPAVDRIMRGMLAAPHMVGGTNRLDTDVMTATGDVVVKGGAEALLCATLPRQGLGVAMKVSDGYGRRASPAFLQVLRQLDAVDDRALERLRRHARIPVLGGDEPQGEVEAVVRLRRGQAD
jgi:L-asparaginase II